MSLPTADAQLKFLSNLQRLLAEGQFVATYKYALLLSLADIAVEDGDGSGDPLTIPTKKIAEKFIQYYWRQCMPYISRSDPLLSRVLRQNTGQQAAILRSILEARTRYGDSLTHAQRDPVGWQALVQKVAHIVCVMPLWKLQTVGQEQLNFLYANRGTGMLIELCPGVAYCLRQFYGLIGDLVRGAWVRYIRRHNHEVLGTATDLTEFLFGSERADLSMVRTILQDVQQGQCFYCKQSLLHQTSQVDHFIPWAKYPVDLGHNFVLAHANCNGAKADHLAAADYLRAWAYRNAHYQADLATVFMRHEVLYDLSTSIRIATWAYSQTFAVGGLTWWKEKELVSLPADWQTPLL